jgi:hypothetical protein
MKPVHVGPSQSQYHPEAGQHEREAGESRTDEPAADVAGVKAELGRERSGES